MSSPEAAKAEPTGSREVLEAGRVESPVARLLALLAPSRYRDQGPAIIEEPGSTIWVASGMAGEVDRYGNFVITTDVTGELAGEAELVEEA